MSFTKIFKSNKYIPRYIITHIKRNIMTTSARAEKAKEEMNSNPYYEKYANKIAELQLTSPEEFVTRMEALQEKKDRPTTAKKEKQFSSLLQPKKQLPSAVDVQEDTLDQIMKLDLIKDKDQEEIQEIWQQYHIHKDVIAATIPADDFDVMSKQFQKFPTFIFPLPRSQGYEFIMSQCKRNAVHFTPLICFQVHKENAPECLTITHYTDLKESKGIVLMRGEFDKTAIDAKEAQCLANQVLLYYSQKDAEKNRLLEQFSTKPDEFKHIDLIKQIENIPLKGI